MIKNFRHPDRSRAQRGAAEGPILRGPADKKRSLGYAAPLDFARGKLAASLGMTE